MVSGVKSIQAFGTVCLCGERPLRQIMGSVRSKQQTTLTTSASDLQRMAPGYTGIMKVTDRKPPKSNSEMGTPPFLR
jgi:hypothetical protein